jgi:hypothetical protein
MAEIPEKDRIALHEFSVRYRAAYAASHPLSDLHLETIQDAVRSDWEQEKKEQRGPTIEPPAQEKEREPEEPEI